MLGWLDEQHPTIELIWLDGGYANTVDDHLIGCAAQHLVVKLEVVKTQRRHAGLSATTPQVDGRKGAP